MRRLSWLQLTDFHCGMTDQEWRWPNMQDLFFKDLETMFDKTGPWSVVFFTGDLVQGGKADEFNRLNNLLELIWKKFDDLGCKPLLVPVPGNHDLQWFDEIPDTVRLLIKWNEHQDIHEDFWKKPESTYRKIIEQAFTNYCEWLKKCPYIPRSKFTGGLLPGEFSMSDEQQQIKLGVVGLNTAFLQLDRGDFKNKLVLHPRQLQAACDGDAPSWVAKHDVCILLTHHGPDWLYPNTLKDERLEISPAGRFLVHLFGHMHEPHAYVRSLGGAPDERFWQGKALFGLEKYEGKLDRHHGYNIGTLDFDDEGRGYLRLWPRTASPHPTGWQMTRDQEFYVLDEDGGTKRKEVLKLPSLEKRSPKSLATQIDDEGPDFAKCLKEIGDEFRPGGIFWAFTQIDIKSDVDGNDLLQIAFDRLVYASTRLHKASSANMWVCHRLYDDGKPRFLRSTTREGYFEFSQLVLRPELYIQYRPNEIFYTSLEGMLISARTVVEKRPIFRPIPEDHRNKKEISRGITHILGVPSRDYDKEPTVVKGEPLSITVDFKFPDAQAPSEEEMTKTAGDPIRKVFQEVWNLWHVVKNKKN